MTFRAALLQAIQTQLATLTVVNGYSTDVGLNVVYWQDLPVEYDGPAMVTFFDEQGETQEIGALHEHRLKVRFDAIAYIASDPIAESCNLLADLIAVVGKNRRWVFGVVNTYLTGNTKEIETRGRQAVLVSLEIEIVYRAPYFKI